MPPNMPKDWICAGWCRSICPGQRAGRWWSWRWGLGWVLCPNTAARAFLQKKADEQNIKEVGKQLADLTRHTLTNAPACSRTYAEGPGDRDGAGGPAHQEDPDSQRGAQGPGQRGGEAQEGAEGNGQGPGAEEDGAGRPRLDWKRSADGRRFAEADRGPAEADGHADRAIPRRSTR